MWGYGRDTSIRYGPKYGRAAERKNELKSGCKRRIATDLPASRRGKRELPNVAAPRTSSGKRKPRARRRKRRKTHYQNTRLAVRKSTKFMDKRKNSSGLIHGSKNIIGRRRRRRVGSTKRGAAKLHRHQIHGGQHLCLETIRVV